VELKKNVDFVDRGSKQHHGFFFIVIIIMVVVVVVYRRVRTLSLI
jgi:hypothetical protein